MAEKYVHQPHPRVCPFCKDDVKHIDYKDVTLLRKYMTDRGKIKPSRVTGVCVQHQHDLALAIKRAREMALVPYSVTVVNGRSDRKKHKK
ncbi:MAG: 30S ribosomal protein S18 [Coriobacteriales bacterium]|jgi:small subunit ribosomal protein S18|nr:30S ribosomal protein S18 [Coriobacteriales bacterium]